MNKAAAPMLALGRQLARRPSAKAASKPLHMLRAYRPRMQQGGQPVPPA